MNPAFMWTLLIHAGATLAMVGLIWFVQVVHYPLFEKVSPNVFIAYEAAHTQRTSWVVMPLMLTEAFTALVLAIAPPPNVASGLAWGGLGLVGLVWATTFFVSVPQHVTLGKGFDPHAHSVLVSTNWIRTMGWSARGVVALWMLTQALQHRPA